jgi:L-arabinose isomerase
MSIGIAELDKMQADYKTAVEDWIAAIRQEEALASVEHSVADVDKWEAAGFSEEDARKKAKDAKKVYEDGLREEFYNF